MARSGLSAPTNVLFGGPAQRTTQSSETNLFNGMQHNDPASEQRIENECADCCYLGRNDGRLHFCPSTPAQDAIRVETNQVVVPAFVLDEDRTYRLWKNPENLARGLLAGDMKLVDAIAEGIVIRGLTTADFHVFDDGKEQVIQNVSYERSVYWDVRDNGGHHTEYIGPGGGKWSTAEWPPGGIGDIEPPHYLVAYALPESPEGSCHKIELKVNRRQSRHHGSQ